MKKICKHQSSKYVCGWKRKIIRFNAMCIEKKLPMRIDVELVKKMCFRVEFLNVVVNHELWPEILMKCVS